MNELKGHDKTVSSLGFLSSDRILFSTCHDDGTACSWDVERGTLLHTFTMAKIQDGIGSSRHPFAVAADLGQGTAKVCDTQYGCCRDLPTSVAIVGFAPDGNSFLAGGNGEGLTSWDLRPLLEYREQESNPEAWSSERINSPNLVGTPLKGPQVCPLVISHRQKP